MTHLPFFFVPFAGSFKYTSVMIVPPAFRGPGGHNKPDLIVTGLDCSQEEGSR